MGFSSWICFAFLCSPSSPLRRIDDAGRGGKLHSDTTVRVASSASANVHPASAESCSIPQGYSLQSGCMTHAMQPIPYCKDDSSHDEVCINEIIHPQSSQYTTDVRTSSEYSRLSKSVTQAEGTAFGQYVSGSFSYIQNSHVTEQSVAFFLGKSSMTKRLTVQNSFAMRLTAYAKSILETNATKFMEQFGRGYIHSVAYGGSFLGSVTLNSKQTASNSDLEAFVNISVHKGLFSAKGGQEFQNSVAKSKSGISIFVNAQATGGVRPGRALNTPEDLKLEHDSWVLDGSNSVPLTVSTLKWTNTHEILQIVAKMSVKDRNLFTSGDIKPFTQEMISLENAEVSKVSTAVTLALKWKEVQGDTAARTCFNKLQTQVFGQSDALLELDELAILKIEAALLAGDKSWFKASELQTEYTKCVAEPDRLWQGQSLREGEKLVSKNKKVYAKMQSDGNFCVYTSSDHWCSQTNAPGVTRLILQNDGNLALYTDGRFVKSLTKRGYGKRDLRLVMQNDCNLVMYDYFEGPLWAKQLKC